MIVHQTNQFGVYIGSLPADPDPLQPGQFLIPGGCVLIPPPDFPDGYMAVWNGRGWDVVPIPPPPAGQTEPSPPDADTKPLDPAELQALLAQKVDDHVEATARSRGYNGAAHMASYVTSTVPGWATEAVAFVVWRDQVWLTVFDYMLAVQTGAKPIPSEQTLLDALPKPNWP